MEKFEILSDPKLIYKKMLADIKSAKHSIFLETYIYEKDSIGRLFRDELTKKAKQGVKILLLIDSFGGKISKDFFSEIIENGGELRFCRSFRYKLKIFSENQGVNHRKLLIIDKKITYTGSINITSDCFGWRELVIKLDGPITEHFVSSFNESWQLSKFTRRKVKLYIHKGFEIINDFSSHRFTTQNKYINLIKNSQKEILIETPYFVPSLRIRRALAKAVKRGVEVKILLPHISDLPVLDTVRNIYFEALFKKGIKIYYYMKKKSHSKLLIVDNKYFMLGSSNLDNRSFLHDYQINLFGKDKRIISALKSFFENGIKNSKPFDYEKWKSRSLFIRTLEMIFSMITYYL